MTLEAGGEWGNRKAVFEGSARFAAGGGKLVRLEFPKTEIQAYGSTAIVYSSYVYEIEQGGKRSCELGPRHGGVRQSERDLGQSELAHGYGPLGRVTAARGVYWRTREDRSFNAETQRTRQAAQRMKQRRHAACKVLRR